MMYGLFKNDMIEDFYEAPRLICVAHSREHLEHHIEEIKVKQAERARLIGVYRSIEKEFPEFDEPAPEWQKLGFSPKTREEHKLAEKNIANNNKLYQEYMKKREAYNIDRENQAWSLFLDIEGKHFTELNKKDIINKYNNSNNYPKMYIEEVKCLE